MKRTSALKKHLGLWLPALLLLAAAALFLVVLRDAGSRSREEELRAAELSLRRAVVTCYAVEGSYPESYAYVRDNYGLRIDEERFLIHYSAFASNLMPEIMIIERAGDAG